MIGVKTHWIRLLTTQDELTVRFGDSPRMLDWPSRWMPEAGQMIQDGLGQLRPRRAQRRMWRRRGRVHRPLHGLVAVSCVQIVQAYENPLLRSTN